ncbi:MFS transporter [Candidatus Competibacter phosphatis]|uniref:MFS transporter n=1 Tax=Candidatus Competibacter phosphatis TaxID=221280 RepID=A0ABX1TK11_9GAMM|nr:MFS transporter [Candidatus Competibacter phosphatis]NMQ19722.1 MFS transporter [Candidatus Competibacter phosphatis]
MIKQTSPNVPAVLAVYLIAFLQGLTLVSFPASSAVLRQMHGFTDAQYGAIFLPQVALAVLGAVAGGTLARRLGLQPLLWLTAAGNGLSQLALAASLWVMPALAFPVILAGTALLGWSFGLGGAPLNSYPPQFFPRRAPAAVVALHTLLGLGLMVGPLLADGFGRAGWWVGFPLSLLGLSALLALAAATVRLPSEAGGEMEERRVEMNPPLISGAFWIFAAIAVLYAFAEGTFSNWAVIYLREAKDLSAVVAALALSVFWGAMVVGRLLVAVLVVRIAPLTIWLALPVLMIAAFLLLPGASTPALGLGLFALAGLACSAFFPLTITLASERFPEHVAWVSSMLIAALMVGVGLGSFVIGPLREWLSLEQIYQFSAAYPIAVIGLALWLAGSRRRLAVEVRV